MILVDELVQGIKFLSTCTLNLVNFDFYLGPFSE